MTGHRFRVGDAVRISSKYDLAAGKLGRVGDPPLDIKRHQETHGLGKYRDHVRVDPSGALIYWIQFAPATHAGEAEASEIEEAALESVSP